MERAVTERARASPEERLLRYASRGMGYAANCAVAVALVCAAALAVLPLKYAAATIVASVLVAFQLPGAASERKLARIEKEIVPFLVKMAKLPKGTPSRAVFERVQPQGELASILASARNSYLKSSGRISAEDALEEAFRPYLERSGQVALLLEAVKTGISHNFDACDFLLKVSREIEEVREIEERRRASVELQKYTILSAGAFFVPFMMGAVSSIVGLLARMGGTSAAFGVSFQGDPAALKASLFAYSVLIMPAMSAAIASLAIEKRPQNLAAYLVVLEAAAIASFSAACAVLPA